MSKFKQIIQTIQIIFLISTITILSTVNVGAEAFFDDEQYVVAATPDTIAFRAINPGYNLSTGKNAGELIELVNLSDQIIALDEISIIYTAKPSSNDTTGKSTILYSFPKNAKMIGKSILLRFQDAPEVGHEDITYSNSIAMYGSLALVKGQDLADESSIITQVCWLGGEECLPYFSSSVKSRSYTTILRDDETGIYSHVNDYQPLFDEEYSALWLPDDIEDIDSDEEDEVEDGMEDDGDNEDSENGEGDGNVQNISKEDSICYGLNFSEILSYYESDPKEQFVELIYQNQEKNEVELSQCFLRYKNKKYKLSEEKTILHSGDYYVFRPDPQFRLTKNPSTSNLLEIVDFDDTIVSTLEYPHGQKKSTSFALISDDFTGVTEWRITYQITPGMENLNQEFKICPANKVLNELTGNCVNAATIQATIKDCGPGKYRNPATGRCKSFDTDNESVSECKEGYERNPETNRCRKIKNNQGAEYPLVPITNKNQHEVFIALWAIGAIVALGVGYVIFQYRKEIHYFLLRLVGKIRKKR